MKSRRPVDLLLITGFATLFLLTGCVSNGRHNQQGDVSEHIRPGAPSLGLATTRVFGKPLSPVVRNVAVPFGSLRFAQGLEDELAQTLNPLDIVLVRSRPALTRMVIPSHFTHAIIWLGDKSELASGDIMGIPAVQAHKGTLNAGKTAFESAGDSVRLATIHQITNTSEIVILRPAPLTRERVHKKFVIMFEHLGTPFDYNFDYLDNTKLTCMEVLADAFPEFDLPVRYAAGRFAILPDDLVHLALTGKKRLSVVRYIRSDRKQGYRIHDPAELRRVIRPPADNTKRASAL